MTSNRPYMIRALSDWIIDNGMTPHILVNASYPGTIVPLQYLAEGKIVLNISPAAVSGLSLGLDEILFSARFGGKPFNLQVPINAVLAIYAKENGKGMVFPEQDPIELPDTEASSGPIKSKPSLRIVD